MLHAGENGGWLRECFLIAQKVARGGRFVAVLGCSWANWEQLPDKLRVNHRGFRNV
jgi:hypothetical protein